MHECQKKNIIVNFIIQKLKNKHISLKKYTDWAILDHVTQNLEFWFQYRKCAPRWPIVWTLFYLLFSKVETR